MRLQYGCCGQEKDPSGCASAFPATLAKTAVSETS
jgi:hypothetical protein